MQRHYFQQLEQRAANDPIALHELVSQLAFDVDGLIPVIAQDAETKTVLMFAWMNQEALLKTLSTARMTYWSRSRQQLWTKGETSGHIQTLVSMAFDCDGGAVLCQGSQQGPACHTERQSCFYLQVDTDNQKVWVS